MEFEEDQKLNIQTFGDDIPKPVQSYKELHLGPLAAHVAKHLKTPKQIHKHIMPIILEGRDLLCYSKTGFDMSVAYLISIFSKLSPADKIPASPDNDGKVAPQCLILVPTREYLFNLLGIARKWADLSNLEVREALGGVPLDTQIAQIKEGCDVLIATPGRLSTLIESDVISLSKIKYLCLEATSHTLELGFESEIRLLGENKDMPAVGVRQTLIFSSYLTKEVKLLAQDLLSDFIRVSADDTMSTNNALKHDIRYVDNIDKNAELVDLLNTLEGRILVFVATKTSAQDVDKFLNENGFKSTSIHSGCTQAERNKAAAMFSSGNVNIAVATDVAIRGLPVPEIEHVINYDMPHTIQNYAHSAGRVTPRVVTTFFNENNKTMAKDLVELLEQSQQEVPEWLKDYVPEDAPDTFQHRGGRGRGSRGRGYGSSASTRGSNPYDQYEAQNNNQNDDTGSSNDSMQY